MVYTEDIISSSLEAEKETVALNIFIKNAAWQYLLQKGRKKLNEEKQKGLVGGYFFLLIILFRFWEKISVDNWFGPNKASKDFEFETFK